MQVNRTGYVYANHMFAGTLIEFVDGSRTAYSFTYDQIYLDHKYPPIGVNLPLTVVPHQFDVFPTFFSNLMSEGWVRRHQARKARLDADDQFGLLLANGEELVGAVSVLPEFISTENRIAMAKPPADVPRSLKGYRIGFRRDEFNEVASTTMGNVSISGVQPKVFLKPGSGKERILMPAEGIGPYIVKPSPQELPELAENEHMIMQLCKAVGFNTAENYLVPFECGELAYVTKRFDSVTPHSNERYFVEDLASCMNVAPGMKSAEPLSYEMAIKTAFRLGGLQYMFLLQGFRHVLMAYLVGNNDLHLKNMSLIRSPLISGVFMNSFSYSPLYDMVSVAPYRQYDLSGELSIWLLEREVSEAFSTTSYASYGYYTQHDFFALGDAIGLPQPACFKAIAMLTNLVEKHADKVIAACPGSPKLKTAIVNRIKDRIAAIRRSRINS